MDYKDFDINKTNEYENLKSLIKSASEADGCITNTSSEIFKKHSEVYKRLYNEITINILIIKLKLDKETAKRIHREVWKELDFINFSIEEKCFLNEYIKKILDKAKDELKNIKEEERISGNRLVNFMNKSLDSDADSDKIELYKKQSKFIWEYINNMNSKTKKIFLYKLYGELSFEEISKIMNKDKNEIISIYYNAENQLFSDKKFRKFFE